MRDYNSVLALGTVSSLAGLCLCACGLTCLSMAVVSFVKYGFTVLCREPVAWLGLATLSQAVVNVLLRLNRALMRRLGELSAGGGR